MSALSFAFAAESEMPGPLSAKEEERERRTTERAAKKERSALLSQGGEKKATTKSEIHVANTIEFCFVLREERVQSLSLPPSPRFQGERGEGLAFVSL